MSRSSGCEYRYKVRIRDKNNPELFYEVFLCRLTNKECTYKPSKCPLLKKKRLGLSEITSFFE